MTVPVLLAVGLSAAGWLYLVHVPGGPPLGDALPLDELSRHAAVSLPWFVAVWAAAGLLLGGYARWARIERTTAALLLGLGVGLLAYIETGVAIAVVRQIALRDALDLAARRQTVYTPAVIVAVAAALLAPRRRVGRRAPLVVATIVAAGALLNILHAVLPGDDAGLLHSLTPDAVGPLAHAAGVLVAVALLVAARGLARRRRRAWQVATALAALATALHALRGFNHGSLASAVVLALLLARRHDFDRPGDSATRRLLLERLAIAVPAIIIYASTALWLNRMAADQPFTPHLATNEILSGVFARDVGGSQHLAGSFGDWFPLSLLMLAAAATIWVVTGWLAPWRHRVQQAEHERELARALVQAWGFDTLAPFVLRADKSYFFTEDESAFLAYRVVGCVAIVSGDPVGPPDRGPELVGRFVAHARVRDWRIAILGASERWLPVYAAHGLHSLYHGDEAIVDTASLLSRRTGRPQSAPVGAPARQRRLHGARITAERDPGRHARGPRGGGRRVAWRPARARLRDGARHALRARRFAGRVPRRVRTRRHAGRFPALRALPRVAVALAVIDAQVALDAERLQRVADLRRRRVGSRAWRTTPSH